MLYLFPEKKTSKLKNNNLKKLKSSVVQFLGDKQFNGFSNMDKLTIELTAKLSTTVVLLFSQKCTPDRTLRVVFL